MPNITPTKINIFNFLYLYFTCGNFYNAVEKLEKQYDNNNFEITLPFTTLFYIIQNKESVEKILQANTKAGYQNQNFDVAHGHYLNINALHAFRDGNGMEKNILWKNVHASMAQSVGNRELINKLINKHIHKLFNKPTFDLDIAFEKFMLDFWCEYLFGAKVNADEYQQTRKKLLTALKYAFYDSRLKTIPYLGNLACRFYGYLQGHEFKQVDKELQKFIDQADSGFIHRFKDNLQKSKDFPKDKIDQAVLDNTFDFVLVFDFIHNAMYETLVAIIKQKLDTAIERKSVYTQGLKRAFLFPFRVRVPQQELTLDTHSIAKGTPIYINLVKAGFPHSFGPRSCVGAGVSHWIKEAILSHLENRQFRICQTTYPEERAKLDSLDVPISPERYRINWQYPRNYLQSILPHHAFKGIEHFYDVIKTYENPALFGYITSAFIEKINSLSIDKENLCIATPEVRGIPVAAAVAHELNIPLVIIRKSGKTPGNTFKMFYKNAYANDCLELSTTSAVKNKKAILIDDGIASGETLLSCCRLIEQAQGSVDSILAIANHTYKNKPQELQKYAINTLFDFDRKTLKKGQAINSSEMKKSSPTPTYFDNPTSLLPAAHNTQQSEVKRPSRGQFL